MRNVFSHGKGIYEIFSLYNGVELFHTWVVGKAYAVSDRAQYNGTLYKCIQAHTSQAD